MGLANQLRQEVPIDIAKELGLKGMRRLLQLMSDAYIDLKNRECITASSQEDFITEEWFINIQQRWRLIPAMSLIPIHQKQDDTKGKTRGKKPTVDFCFRHCFITQSYFGVECKLLDEVNRSHLSAYLDDKEGIGRFLDGRYATHASAGAMVGYVRSGNCVPVAKSLLNGISCLNGKPNLKKSKSLKNFSHLYESRHLRECIVPDFLCYHCLFDFSNSKCEKNDMLEA